MMTFNAIDVETANCDHESICQIGVVHIVDGVITDKWQTLVNPEDYFDSFNVEIHGIDEDHVKEAPTLPEIREELRTRLRGSVLVSHTAFDCVAFERAMEKYDLEQLQVTWLDSAKIARRTWPDKYGYRGYGIKAIANDFKISFKHHDALEDASVAAEIVLRACAETGKDIEQWLKRVEGPIFTEKRPSYSVQQEGNKEGALYGETIVFTGSLSRPRQQVADMAANAGCKVKDGVTKDATILVVGLQDREKLAGYEKSSKHRKTEKLIQEGANIKILSERDFFELINVEPPKPRETRPKRDKNKQSPYCVTFTAEEFSQALNDAFANTSKETMPATIQQ